MTDRAHNSSRVSKGWLVTFAGFGTNLALGVLYSWSVFADGLRANGWSATHTQIPYMVACAVFALLMVPAGSLQDKRGPKPMLRIAFILTGVSFILSGFFTSLAGVLIGFGILFGTAMAFGYATTTPTALKWFGSEKRGLISGIVVSGFGLAGLYVAPLTTFLIKTFSLSTTFFILGIFFSVLIAVLHFFVKTPPDGYIPKQGVAAKAVVKNTTKRDINWKEMLKSYHFYILWAIFFLGTLSGLKVLGQLSSIGKEQAGLTATGASIIIMIYALFNCLGRIIYGIVSDKIGRKLSVIIIFTVQLVAFFFFSRFTSFTSLAIGTVMIALSFGGMLSLFPSITADYYGVKNLGTNYGLVFTAWGFGGVIGPLIGGLIRDSAGKYDMTYTISAIACALGLLLAIFLRSPQRTEDAKAEE